MAQEGVSTQKHIPITGDVHDITQRLKEIDGSYFVMLNRRTGYFEVHHSGQIGDTLACTLPFDRLDARTLTLVRESSVSRAHHYLAKLDEQNALLQERLTKAAVSEAAKNCAQD